MAGIIPNAALVNNFDANGTIMSGALLRIYEPTTVVPVTAYKDSGLTVGNEHPWPIRADAAGRIPMFWVPDGSYRVRLSSADGGYVAYDIPIIASISPSAGGGGGGGVSSEVIFQTGDVLWLPKDGTRSGWVRHNGRTIGAASSGATERANADTSDLYSFLWTAFDNTVCPVTGGRGATAAADFAANKPIATLDLRFVSPIGMDTMGNSAAGRASGVPVVSGSGTAPASVLGETTHVLTKAESAVLAYATGATQNAHSHTVGAFSSSASSSNFGAGGGTFGETTLTTSAVAPAISATTTADAGGGAHNNTPRVMTGSYYVKL